MHVIIITKTANDGGYQARLHDKSEPPTHAFAKTEIEALEHLLEILKERNDKWI